MAEASEQTESPVPGQKGPRIDVVLWVRLQKPCLGVIREKLFWVPQDGKARKLLASGFEEPSESLVTIGIWGWQPWGSVARQPVQSQPSLPGYVAFAPNSVCGCCQIG